MTATKEYFRKRYLNKRDEILAQNKKWREKNKIRMRELTYRWRANNPEAAQKIRDRWVKKNPEKFRIYAKNRRALKKGSVGQFTETDVANILKMQNGKCAMPWCRAKLTGENMHVDHIIPLSLGGSNDKTNIQCLCQPCNQRKYNKHPVEFARLNGALL